MLPVWDVRLVVTSLPETPAKRPYIIGRVPSYQRHPTHLRHRRAQTTMLLAGQLITALFLAQTGAHYLPTRDDCSSIQNGDDCIQGIVAECCGATVIICFNGKYSVSQCTNGERCVITPEGIGCS